MSHNTIEISYCAPERKSINKEVFLHREYTREDNRHEGFHFVVFVCWNNRHLSFSLWRTKVVFLRNDASWLLLRNMSKCTVLCRFRLNPDFYYRFISIEVYLFRKNTKPNEFLSILFLYVQEMAVIRCGNESKLSIVKHKIQYYLDIVLYVISSFRTL